MKLKLLPIIFILLFLCYRGSSQTVLARSVTGSTGGSVQTGNTLIQFTVGEPAVLTLQNNNSLLTQGFHQPEFAVSTPNLRLVKDMIVYPNPATTKTRVEFDLLSDASVLINLVNNAGQVVHSSTINTLAGKIEYVIPLNGFASGVYYIILYVNYRTFSEKLVIQ